MNSHLTLGDIFSKIQKKFNTVIIITLIFILVGVGVTLVIPKQYRGEAQLVVLQKSNPNIDSYTAQRSIDANVNLLINLVYTDVFFGNFIADNVDIKNAFPENIEDRRKLFARNILVRSKGTGFVTVETYDYKSELALTMNKVVVNKIIEQARLILGDAASIQVVNQPALYEGVGRPNILINLFGSAILGFVISIAFVLTRKDQSITYDFGIEEVVSPELPDDVEIAQNPIINFTEHTSIIDKTYESDNS